MIKTLEQLVFNFFQLANLSPVQIRRGVWQVKIDEPLMKELDGWRAQARILQFTFEPALAKAYGADLISLGSYRLNSIIQVIRKQGLLSRAYIPHHFFHEPNIRKKVLNGCGVQKAYVVNSSLQFNQYFLFNVLAKRRGLTIKESIHTSVVNLSSGTVLNFALPTHLLVGGTVEKELQRKRKCSYKKALEAAVADISKEIAAGDNTWAEEAHEKLKQEKERLLLFFENQTDSADFAVKKQELLTRLAPHVELEILRCALLYIPVFCYRLMLVEADGSEKLRDFLYDPVSNLQETN